MKKSQQKLFLFIYIVLFFAWAPSIVWAQACKLTRPALTGKGNIPSTITSKYGMRKHPISGQQKMHEGTDISSPGSSDCGQPTQLESGCTATFIKDKYPGQKKGYGNQVAADCGNGVKYTISHLQSYNAATKTMYVGSTGHSTGCHIHYEAFIDGKLVDPECIWGTGKNCPSGLGSGNTSIPNLCDANQRNALKNHSTSIPGTPPAGGDTPPSSPTDPSNPTSPTSPNTPTTPSTPTTPTTPTTTTTGGEVGEEPQKPPEETTPIAPTPAPEYQQEQTQVICDNSTCITQTSIAVARHKDVQSDKVTSHVNLIKPPESGTCPGVSESGAEVYRQSVESLGGFGRIVKHKDGYCINQGCTYTSAGEGARGTCD